MSIGRTRYGRSKAPNTIRTIIVEPGKGLNEVSSPLNISDGQACRSRNFYSPDGVSLCTIPCEEYSNPYPYARTSYWVATYNGTGSNVLPMVAFVTSGVWKANYLVKSASVDYNVSSHNFILDHDKSTHGAVEYITQAASYSVYWSELMNSLMIQNQNTGVVTLETLPANVYPKAVVSHRTRLFLIDTNNTLWWCDAGEYTTWYGGAVDEEYKAEDAGYWFIDSAETMNTLASFNGQVYIFSYNSIYVFSGYSSDTFVLTPLFSGIGTYPEYEKSVTVSRDAMYFVHDDKVYSFDGIHYPVLISEPQYVNGVSVNNITCGINPKQYNTVGPVPEWDADWSFRALTCTSDKVYLYPLKTRYAYYQYGGKASFFLPFYVFDTSTRAWWMHDGAYLYYSASSSVENEFRMIACGGTDNKITEACTLFKDADGAVPTIFSTIEKMATFTQRLSNGADISPAGTQMYSNGYYCRYISKAFSTTLDSELKLYEVDILWSYNGEILDGYQYKRFVMLASWANLSDMVYPGEYGTVDDYQGGTNDVLGTLEFKEKFDTYDEDNLPEWETFLEDTSYGGTGVVPWVYEVNTTRFKYAQRSAYNSNSTPFVCLNLLVQYEAVKIHRIELKYRAIGASK